MRPTHPLLIAALSACNPLVIEDSYDADHPPSHYTDTAPPDTEDTDDTDDTDTDEPDDTGDTDTDEPDDTGDTTPVLKQVDCSKLPDEPISIDPVPGARGYHGLAFDDVGNIIGSDGNSLIASTREGDWGVLTPSIGWVEQIDRLPDGDLAVLSTNNSTIQRVDTTTGASSTLATAISGYGLTVGPDGMIYVANYQTIVRVDPDTGEKSDVVPGIAWAQPKVVNFSPDHDIMYIGTLYGGRILAVPLDEDLNPTGEAEVLATNVGGWHDGLGVDVCGNLYLNDYTNTALFRVSPDGEYTMMVDFNSSAYGHGLVWGTGQDGWREDALYMPLPYNNNNVQEVVIGVPMRGWEGEVINGP